MTLDLDHLLTYGAIAVPVASALASALNHAIRERMKAAKKVSPWLAGLAVFVNALAMNGDKALQMAGVARGK